MSGAVYQPTTVQYESSGGGPAQDHRWQDRPISYLASSVSHSTRRPCLPLRAYMPILLTTSCVACFSLGLVMLVQGAKGYSDTPPDKEAVYLAVTIFGAIFFAISILLFVCFLRLSRRICWRNMKDHLNSSGGQNLTVNPSTDLLVAAQYAPVSEVAYQPSADDSEQSKLMPHDHKDITNEEADRLVDSDPRIVLRPLNHAHDET